MSELIDRQSFIENERKLYCEDCDRRKGTKNGKPNVICYEIGEAPCRACWLDDALTDLEDFPTASPWHRVEDGLPESGTHVLACCEVRGIYGHKSHYVCDAFHTDNKSIPCSYNDDIDSEYDEETDEYYFPVGWWEVIKNWDDYSCVAINDFVTHWMPLPEPPKEDE